MGRRRKAKRKPVKARNPLAPVVRALAPRVKPSARAYTRKAKHRRRGADEDRWER
ncbi:MAG: hypothetical protein ACE5GS_09055 [Kiloniellaceae bacterium]